MSVGYRAVHWTPHKRVYDACVLGAVAVYFALFMGVGKAAWAGVHSISDEVLLIRASGSCALVLLHVILCIGPLARFEPRLLPVLSNRRHLGVVTFLMAFLHATLSTGYYHGFGVISPLLSLLSINTEIDSLSAFPYQWLGLGALLILFLLAATSHDFWLKNLSPGVWKSLHMLVYAAYVLLVGHVVLGSLAAGRGSAAVIALVFGAAIVTGLHIAAALREWRHDAPARPAGTADESALNGWIDAGAAGEIPTDRARTVCAAGPGGQPERIAVFRYNNTVSAVTNVCAHQGGPLGEGAIIDGCITCPWHGWQYKPHDGCSPPPFSEKIATYQVRVVKGRVWVDPTPLPPGTPVTPAAIAPSPIAESAATPESLYVGYLPAPAWVQRFVRVAVPGVLAAIALAAAIAGVSQRDPGSGVWEDARTVEMTGTLLVRPYPMLLVESDGPGSARAVLLVEQGKHGAIARSSPLAGRTVTAKGAPLSRGSLAMLELVPGDEALTEASGGAGAAEVQTPSLGVLMVSGEIVDSKCYLGAMKPGDGKTHKECAMLCVLGGIPPLLVSLQPMDGITHFLVVDSQGGVFDRGNLRFLAERVLVTGEVHRVGNLGIIRAGVGDIQRR